MELRERRPDTLREKLRASYHNKEFSPEKVSGNKVAISFFFGLVLVSFIQCVFFLLPHIYPDRISYWTMLLVTIVILLEVLVNWHRAYWDVDNYVRGNTKEKHFPALQETPEGWRTCLTCQVDAPPRSHHCKHCGKCIMKRDHHCFFTGSCIGYFNQKFFWTYCFHSVLASLYMVVLQISYLQEDLPIFSWDIFTYLLPVTLYKWLAGYITFGQAFIIAHLCTCIFCLGLAAFFFLWQTFVISQGVTSHEGWKGIMAYKGTSVSENVKSVFGSLVYIPIILVFPFRFELAGDGIQWEMRSKRVKGH